MAPMYQDLLADSDGDAPKGKGNGKSSEQRFIHGLPEEDGSWFFGGRDARPAADGGAGAPAALAASGVGASADDGVDAPRWRVISSGAILVRLGRDMSAAKASKRLSAGALVKELQLYGDRLRYRLLSGTGPLTGWVSTAANGKPLLEREGERASSSSTAPASATGEGRAEQGRQPAHATPSLESIMSELDAQENEGGSTSVPSLEELLASIDRDVRDERQVEADDAARSSFFELGTLSKEQLAVRVEKPPTKEELEVTTDIMATMGKFSYSSTAAIGRAIMAERERTTGLVIPPKQGSGESGENDVGAPGEAAVKKSKDWEKLEQIALDTMERSAHQPAPARRAVPKTGHSRSSGRVQHILPP